MTILGRLRRYGTFAALALAATSAGSCVEGYQGSWLEFILGPGVQVPDDNNPGFGKPPSGTHYEFWVSTNGQQFHMADFQVVRQVDLNFVCFIEEDDSLYPGLHSTRWYDKTLEVALSDGDATTPDDKELPTVVDAFERVDRMKKVATGIKAVVGFDRSVTPQDLADLKAEVDSQASVDQMDDASNAKRRTICRKFFADHPDYFVGADRVLSLPLNGHWYGLVEGTDPRNNANVGGSGFTVPISFDTFDYLWITWQFNDLNDPRIASTYGPSAYGYHYMTGTPQFRTRRTINVQMQNQQFAEINAEVALFPGINRDDVQF